MGLYFILGVVLASAGVPFAFIRSMYDKRHHIFSMGRCTG